MQCFITEFDCLVQQNSFIIFFLHSTETRGQVYIILLKNCVIRVTDYLDMRIAIDLNV